MKITIWHIGGSGTEMTADDFAYIEVDGKTVWNKALLEPVEGQKPPTNSRSRKCPHSGKVIKAGTSKSGRRCRQFNRA